MAHCRKDITLTVSSNELKGFTPTALCNANYSAANSEFHYQYHMSQEHSVNERGVIFRELSL